LDNHIFINLTAAANTTLTSTQSSIAIVAWATGFSTTLSPNSTWTVSLGDSSLVCNTPGLYLVTYQIEASFTFSGAVGTFRADSALNGTTIPGSPTTFPPLAANVVQSVHKTLFVRAVTGDKIALFLGTTFSGVGTATISFVPTPGLLTPATTGGTNMSIVRIAE